MTLKFNDGVSVNTGGPLRLIRLPDGLYVTGWGYLIPVDDWDEGTSIIAELKSKGDDGAEPFTGEDESEDE